MMALIKNAHHGLYIQLKMVGPFPTSQAGSHWVLFNHTRDIFSDKTAKSLCLFFVFLFCFYLFCMFQPTRLFASCVVFILPKKMDPCLKGILIFMGTISILDEFKSFQISTLTRKDQLESIRSNWHLLFWGGISPLNMKWLEHKKPFQTSNVGVQKPVNFPGCWNM